MEADDLRIRDCNLASNLLHQKGTGIFGETIVRGAVCALPVVDGRGGHVADIPLW